MADMTPEEQASEKEALNVFIKEYGELVAKHKFDFIAYPIWQPSDTGEWKMSIQTQAVSTKNKPVRSPFVPQ